MAVFLLWREGFITTGKKRYSRLSGGCAIIITTGKKKDTVVCLVSARSLLRPEKKDTVICLAGCAVVSVNYNRKKKFLSSVWRVVLCNEFVLVLMKIDLIHFEH